jgi:hypothetical protein
MTQIVVNKNSKIVIYAGEKFVFDPYLIGQSFIDSRVTADAYDIFTVTIPKVYAPGVYTYDNGVFALVGTLPPDLALIAADDAAKTEAKLDPVVQYLVTHTPTECSAYVATNVTNLATAVSLLQKFAIALCVLSKKEFR